MFDIFSTREIATAIYLILMIGWLCSTKNGYKSLLNVFKATCKTIIIAPIIFLFLYAVTIVYMLRLFPVWNWLLIKDVVLWVIFVATPIFFKAGMRKLDTYPLSKMISDNFAWSALLEFFIGSFTFHLGVELIVIPFFAFIAIIKEWTHSNPAYKNYQRICDGITMFSGTLLLFFTIRVAINVISTEGAINTLVSFSIPIIFSIAFLPIIYLLAVWAQYHDLFVRIYIRNHISKNGLRIKEAKIFLACGLSYKKLLSFRNAYTDYIVSIRSANDDEDFFSFIEKFKKEHQ